MFLHADNRHIISNCIMQLVVGIPIEMSQPGWMGSLRVGALYMAGVIFGSLGASIVSPNTYLVGASAGVYAIVMAHLATLILNWKEDGQIYAKSLRSQKDPPPMNLNPWIRGLRLAFVILFIVGDVGNIIYDVYYLEITHISYAGHAFGALAGVLIGVFVLQNRKVEDWELIFQWCVFALYGVCLCAFVLWHIIGSNGITDWFPAEKWNSTCTDF